MISHPRPSVDASREDKGSIKPSIFKQEDPSLTPDSTEPDRTHPPVSVQGFDFQGKRTMAWALWHRLVAFTFLLKLSILMSRAFHLSLPFTLKPPPLL